MPFGLWTRVGPRNLALDGAQIPHAKVQLLGERSCPDMPITLCRELWKNGWTDRFVVWVVDSDESNKAQVKWYSAGGANAPSWGSTLAPPRECQRTVCLRQRCSLMSNWFLPLVNYKNKTGFSLCRSFKQHVSKCYIQIHCRNASSPSSVIHVKASFILIIFAVFISAMYELPSLSSLAIRSVFQS